jgi:hypothetical protein
VSIRWKQVFITTLPRRGVENQHPSLIAYGASNTEEVNEAVERFYGRQVDGSPHRWIAEAYKDPDT